MTMTNEILPFGSQGKVAANDVLALSAYEAAAERLVGNQPGIASRALVNTVLRQVSHVAAGLATFVSARYEPGVVDDGDLAKVHAGLVAAIASVIAEQVDVDHATRTDNPHQVTAAQLPDLGAATTTAPGLVELATPAEAQAGTDDTRAVTPAGLAAALGGLSPAQCRAWVLFDGSTSPPTIRGSYNVVSVTRHGQGDYTVSFLSALPSADYAVCGTASGTDAGTTEDMHGICPNLIATSTPLTASSVRVVSLRDVGSSAGGGALDAKFATVAVFA